MKTHQRLGLALTLPLLGFSLSSSAALVVDLEFEASGNGPDYATTRTPDTATADEINLAWDATTPLLDGDPARSQIVYGGYNATGPGIVGDPDLIINDVGGTGTDFLRLSNVKTADGEIRARGILLWDSNHFLESANTFDGTANSSLSTTIYRWSNADVLRFVIRDGSTYYLSSESAEATGIFTVSGDTAGLQWAEFDPGLFAAYSAGEGDIGVGGTALSYATRTFSNVTGVGLITELHRPGTLNTVFDVADFQANLAGDAATWGSYPVQVVDGAEWIDTGSWMGWLALLQGSSSHSQWVYSLSLDTFLYFAVPPAEATTGSWAFFLK